MSYSDIIGKVSKELELPENLIDKVYKAYWSFIRTTIQSLPLKEDINEEDFSKLRTSINIPSIGKLYCSYDKYLGVKKRFEYINHLKDKNDKAKED